MRRLGADNTISTLCVLPSGRSPDGFKIDCEGNVRITVTAADGLDSIAWDGSYLKFFRAGGVPLNGCFDCADLIFADFGIADTTGR